MCTQLSAKDMDLSISFTCIEFLKKKYNFFFLFISLFLRSISSIRGELVPYLVRKQFSKAANSQKMKDDSEDQTQKKNDGSTNHGYCFY